MVRDGLVRRTAGLVVSCFFSTLLPSIDAFQGNGSSVAKVAPIDKLSVVLVAVFGVVFLGEKLSAPNWFGVALIAVGAVLVAYR